MALRLEVIQHFDDTGRGDRPPRAAQRLRRHQARRAAHRPGEPVGGLLPRRQGPRHLHLRPPHPDHAQPAAAGQADRPALRRQVALPGPGLLHQPPDLHRPEVGHQGAASPSATASSRMVRLRAFGRFSMRVADPQIFLQQLVGTTRPVHHGRRRGLPARHLRGAPQRPARRDAEDDPRPARATTTSWRAGSRDAWPTTSPSTGWSSSTSSSARSRRPRKSRR